MSYQFDVSRLRTQTQVKVQPRVRILARRSARQMRRATRAI